MKSRFWHGYIVAGCVTSLYQDFLGKEEYLRRAATSWIDGSITVPVAMLVLALVYLSHKADK